MLRSYLDGIFVKSRKVFNHVNDIMNIFVRCKLSKLRMNPFKCVFAVSSGIFVGLVVHRKGIDLDSSKLRLSKLWSLP